MFSVVFYALLKVLLFTFGFWVTVNYFLAIPLSFKYCFGLGLLGFQVVQFILDIIKHNKNRDEKDKQEKLKEEIEEARKALSGE